MATSMSDGLHVSENSRLNFDDSGFLVGQRRLEQNVKSVAENTHEILELLKAQLKARELNPPEHQLSAFQKAIIEANRRTIIDTTTELARQQRSTSSRAAPQRPTRDTDQQATSRPAANNSVISRRPTLDVQSPADLPKRQANDTSNSSQSTPTRERTRDAKGRFIGEGGENGTGSDSNWLERVKNSIQSGVKDGLPTDVRGVDPTVDAINELGTLLSPVGKAASFTLRPLNAMLRGRKRNEPLPREEAQHNREQIRLLRRIADQNGNNAGMGAGMGKVAIGMISAVARHFPMIAAALGIKAALDEADKNRPAEQGDTNPDGTTNTGELGALNRMSKNTMNAVRGAGNAVNSTLGGDADYFDDGTTVDSKNRLGLKTDVVNGGVGSTQKDRIKQSYNAAIAAGFSHNQAVALIGELGRENDFSADKMFGGHPDPARGQNLGIFSWQGNRRKALEKYLSERGMLNKDGTIKRSQEALKAQFEFTRIEMANNEKWENGFLKNKEISINEARPQLGGIGSYIGWARGQTSIRKADGSRVPFNWKKQEAKANRFSALAEAYAKTSKSVTPKSPEELAKFAQEAEVPASQPANNSYSRLNTNPAKPTQKAAVIPLKPTNTRSAPQLTPLAPVPSVKESLTSKQPQIVQLASSSDNIGQNVADRDIAHSVTGGLGARNWDA